MKNLLLTLTAVTLSASLTFAQAKSKEELKKEVKAQVEKTKEACAADVATTGCKGEGKEKMQCLHAYKKEHKDFKFSEGCKSAMKEGREMRHELKEMRKHKQAQKDAKDSKEETK